ncbi:MAG TPA: hypothetical protein DHW17_04305 [Nitrospina sp.]|jgi:hypothetical protein|nr:hypothetical protein [Nitrospina sp.]|tara:strand:- start:405 stop:707 length:303 start_codon:yes stop_codon:yes gene_type:complete
MNSQSNPILIELSEQLLETSTTFKYIQGSESYSQVATQAQEEFLCLSDFDADRGNGLSGRNQLAQYGYENWLKDMEEEDRLYLIGTLRLVIDLAEELAEE